MIRFPAATSTILQMGLVLVLASLAVSPTTPVVAREGEKNSAAFFERDVYVSGSEEYHAFRIPALAVTTKGTLLAFCEGRKTSLDDLGNNDLMLKRSTDGGRTWQSLQLLHDEGEKTIGNPVAVVDRKTGTVWLILLREGRDVLVMKSDNDGRDWSKPVDITAQVKKPEWGFYATGPGVGIQIRHGAHKGRLVIPAYHRTTPDKSGPSTAHVFYSDDHGKTWQLGGSAGLHTNECQLAETLIDGRSVLVLNMRNHWARSGKRPDLAGRRLVSRSEDGGRTWSEPTGDDVLIEPTCQASLVSSTTPDGKDILLFSNPAAKSRTNLTVRLSRDGGQTWPVSRQVYAGSSAYSCLAALPDGRIGVLYERDNYGKLTFASFTLDWLTAGAEQQQVAFKPRLPRDNLLVYRGPNNEQKPVRSIDDWQKRRQEIVAGMQIVMGRLPGPERRCPLDMKIEEEVDCGSYIRRLITYASEPGSRVPAYLLIPKSALEKNAKKVPAVLCLHGTNNVVGHGVVVGIGNTPNRQYASELAERGYVTLAPNYPLLAKYQPDLKELGWESGTLKAVWDNIRGLDLLESLSFVQSDGFGAIGHSLGGHNAVYTSVFDERITAVISSCGLDSYLDYYGGNEKNWLPEKGWTQTRYMARMADYRGRLEEIPFDFHEMVGALAPRHVLIIAPLHDSNFKADSVDRVVAAARDIFKLYGKEPRLQLEHPDCAHDFPPEMRERAYQLLDQVLREKRE